MLPLIQQNQLSILGLPQDDVDPVIDSYLNSAQHRGPLYPVHDDFHYPLAHPRPQYFGYDQSFVQQRDYMADLCHHRSVGNFSTVQADLHDYFVVPTMALQYDATLVTHSVLLRPFLFHGHICRVDHSQLGS